MAHPHFFRDRQGRQFRQCSHCEGAGELTIRHPSGDPQREDVERCHDCGGSGDFRVTAVDLLERLAEARKAYAAGPYHRDLYWRYRGQLLAIDPRLPAYAPSASTEFMDAVSSLTGYRWAA